jgi:crotonobetainyl-CoA:carnitine CoA-transferase CaiB-like acyl-CoA transferase
VALFHRERSGEGQQVDISMADGVTQLLAYTLADFFKTGRPLVRGRKWGNGVLVHYNIYRCQDDKWLSIGCFEPYFYENFCRALGREDWIPLQDTDLETHRGMVAEAREIFLQRTRVEWFTLLNREDQCAMGVLEPQELEADPHLQARGMIWNLEHPSVENVRQVGSAIKLSKTPPGFRSFAPSLGQHTDEVLAGLGFSPEELTRLRAERVIA